MYALLKPVENLSEKILELMKYSGQVIDFNLMQMLDTKVMLQLPYDGMVAILQRDSLIVPNEDVLFQTILDWIEHDVEARTQYLVDLIQQTIRLPFLSLLFLSRTIKAHPLCTRGLNPKLDAILLDTFLAMGSVESNTHTQRRGTIPNQVLLQPNVGVFFLKVETRNFEFKYPCSRKNPILVFSNGYVYAFGGQDSTTSIYLKRIKRFDFTLKAWELLSVTINDRYSASHVQVYPDGGIKVTKSCLSEYFYPTASNELIKTSL